MSLQHNILSQTWTIASNVSCWACGLGFGAEYDYKQHKDNDTWFGTFMVVIDVGKIRMKMQMSVARVPLPTIVVVDSDKSAEDQIRTMVTLYRYA